MLKHFRMLSVLLLISLNACASPIPLRPFEKRSYFFCKPEWMSAGVNYVGKLCYNYCDKTAWYSPLKCVHETMVVEDLTATETFLKFMSSGKRVMRPEDL